MKKYLLIALAAVMLAGLNSCHTSEKNYRASYDKAIAKKTSGLDSLTMSRIEQEKIKATAIIGGDSVRLVTEFVNIIDGKTADMGRYGVVVASFKQVFNARSMRDRINSTAKGKAAAYVTLNRKNDYYVIAQGFDTKEAAAAYLKNLKSNLKVSIPLANPWILARP